MIQFISTEGNCAIENTDFLLSMPHFNSIVKQSLNLKTTKRTSTLIESNFIENVEHDIRTPLSSIFGLVDLLDRRESDPFKRELLGDIAACAQKLKAYYNQMMEFSKIETDVVSNDFENFELKKIIDEIIRLERLNIEAKKLRFKCCYAGSIPTTLFGDTYRLRKILSNLLSNAVKFTHQGEVLIKIFFEKHLSENEVLIRFEIKDTGIGIPLDKQDDIYKKFVRLTPSNKGLYKGLGVGLYIVKKFLAEIKGTIQLISEIDHGSFFICKIPFLLNKVNIGS
ncbi:MAG TPA: HAMP domain-containing sensor histidine kinase [Gammaproteobacteria bacterium]|nr:HAMP domain-containing sensor histidine kinase [Gammaproteobacteria bacterium]